MNVPSGQHCNIAERFVIGMVGTPLHLIMLYMQVHSTVIG